jgi:UPF0755 protein
MKKIILAITFTVIILMGCISGWLLFGPTLHPEQDAVIFVKTETDYNQFYADLKNQQWMRNAWLFDKMSRFSKLPQRLKPGRYSVKNISSLYGLMQKFRTGSQNEIRFVINKLRTKEDLAKHISRSFETDSLEMIQFLMSNDSLKSYGVDTNTMMTLIIPNSYLCWWNGSPRKILDRLSRESTLFWKGKRTAQSQKIGLTPVEVYTMASIVEEETTKKTDKGKIASVYINRIKQSMKLEADPTVKYASRQFSLTRILNVHLAYNSPYNTYQNIGLPPGPICTPSIETIDAVLNAPTTDYLFFVAKPDFSGYSNFSKTYNEHLGYARQYQLALTKLQQKKKS